MASCYRCAYVTGAGGEGVGVCGLCGALACRVDGVRMPVSSQFRCAMCVSKVLWYSGGLGPPPGGGGGPSAPVRTPSDPDGGGGGVYAVKEYLSAEHFSETAPEIAVESFEQRTDWRQLVHKVLEQLAAFADSPAEQARVVQMAAEQHAEEEAPTWRLRRVELIGRELSFEVRHAVDLDTDLIADALGVASWAIDVPVGVDPPPNRLRLLADSRLEFVIAYCAPALA
jgi:hypothetical protein